MFQLKSYLRSFLRGCLAGFSETVHWFKAHRFYIFITILSLITFINCVTARNSDPRYRQLRTGSSVVRVLRNDTTRIGTGFVFEYHGKRYTGTAGHVCQSILAGNTQPKVMASDGVIRQEKVLVYGTDVDGCVLTDSSNSPALSLNTDFVQFASPVYTLGFSGDVGYIYGEGQAGTYMKEKFGSLLLSKGDIEYCQRNTMITMQSIIENMMGVCSYYPEFLVANFRVYPGQSGSPLLNASHEVVGILSMTRPEGSNASLWTPTDYFEVLVQKAEEKR